MYHSYVDVLNKVPASKNRPPSGDAIEVVNLRVAIGAVPGADWCRVANERDQASHSVRVYRNRCGPEDVLLIFWVGTH